LAQKRHFTVDALDNESLLYLLKGALVCYSKAMNLRASGSYVWLITACSRWIQFFVSLAEA